MGISTYHIANPSTGATYVNTRALTIAANANTTATFQADVAGAAGTSAASAITQTITTLVGVSIVGGLQVGTFLGTDPESNASLLARYKAKPASLGKGGNALSYWYWSVSSDEPGYPLPAASRITRAKVTADEASGEILITLANSAGPPSGGDIAAIAPYIAKVAKPDGDRISVVAATGVAISATATLYVNTDKSDSEVIADAQAAYVSMINGLPIGGELDEDGSIGVPHGAVQAALARALPYLRTQKLYLMGMSTEVSYALSPYQVATNGGLAVTIVRVA